MNVTANLRRPIVGTAAALAVGALVTVLDAPTASAHRPPATSCVSSESSRSTIPETDIGQVVDTRKAELVRYRVGHALELLRNR